MFPNFSRISKTTVVEIISSLLLLLFLYTALSKAYEFNSFQGMLAQSPLLRANAVLFARLLPVIEILVAALLFFPRTKLLGLYSSLFLMLVFTLYISYMVIFFPLLPCSCGGVIKHLSWTQHIVFNLFFIVLSVIAILFSKNKFKLSLH